MIPGWFSGETFDASDYERPYPPPVVRERVKPRVSELVHLAQLARVLPSGEAEIFTWCGGKSSATTDSHSTVAFDSRVATCGRCLREHREAVGQ